MVVEAVAPKAAQFSIVRVLADSFGVLRRNLWLVVPTFVIRLLWLLAPSYDRAEIAQSVRELNWSVDIARPVLGMVVFGLIGVAVTFAVVGAQVGRRTGIADVRRGLTSIIPVVIASAIFCVPEIVPQVLGSIVYWLTNGEVLPGALVALGVAFVLYSLVVVTIGIAWSLYTPAIVLEGKGPIAGLTRSAELTKGRRWAILGLFIFVMIIYLVVLAPISIIQGIKLTEVLMPSTLTISSAISHVLQAFLTTFSATVLTLAYCYLRVDKDGIAIGKIAQEAA